MAPYTPNTLDIVQEYLWATGPQHKEQAGTQLDDYVGASYVFQGKTPQDFDGRETAGILVRGGTVGDPYIQLHEGTVLINIFPGGLDLTACYDILQALVDRLHGVNMASVSSGVIVEANQASAPAEVYDEETEEDSLAVQFQIVVRGHD